MIRRLLEAWGLVNQSELPKLSGYKIRLQLWSCQKPAAGEWLDLVYGDAEMLALLTDVGSCKSFGMAGVEIRLIVERAAK